MGDAVSGTSIKSIKTSLRLSRPASSRHPSRAASVRGLNYCSANSFVNYLTEFIRMPENKGTTNKELFKLAGMRWQQMTSDQKFPYIDAARINKQRLDLEKINNPQRRKRQTRVVRIKSRCSACGHKHGEKPKITKRSRAGPSTVSPVRKRNNLGRNPPKNQPTTSHSSLTSMSPFYDSDTMVSSVSSF